MENHAETKGTARLPQAPELSPELKEVLWPYIFQYLNRIVPMFGGEIIFSDLEREVGSKFPETTVRALAYTGLSDGRCIIMHHDVSKVRHPANWAWDALHLFGHMVQWHAPAALRGDLDLSVSQERCREFAVMDFRGAQFSHLKDMQTYEIEANRIALTTFVTSLSSYDYKQGRSRELENQLRNYLSADLDFLTRYYLGSRDSLDGNLLTEAKIIEELHAVPMPNPTRIQFSALADCVPVLH